MLLDISAKSSSEPSWVEGSWVRSTVVKALLIKVPELWNGKQNWKLNANKPLKLCVIYLHIKHLCFLPLANNVFLFPHTLAIEMADPTQARVETIQH